MRSQGRLIKSRMEKEEHTSGCLNAEVIGELLAYYAPEELLELFEAYGRESMLMVRQSFQYFEKKDYISLARVMHTLKGSSGTLGAVRVASLARELECMMASGAHEAVAGKLALVSEAVDAFLKAARDFVAK